MHQLHTKVVEFDHAYLCSNVCGDGPMFAQGYEATCSNERGDGARKLSVFNIGLVKRMWRATLLSLQKLV